MIRHCVALSGLILLCACSKPNDIEGAWAQGDGGKMVFAKDGTAYTEVALQTMSLPGKWTRLDDQHFVITFQEPILGTFTACLADEVLKISKSGKIAKFYRVAPNSSNAAVASVVKPAVESQAVVNCIP